MWANKQKGPILGWKSQSWAVNTMILGFGVFGCSGFTFRRLGFFSSTLFWFSDVPRNPKPRMSKNGRSSDRVYCSSKIQWKSFSKLSQWSILVKRGEMFLVFRCNKISWHSGCSLATDAEHGVQRAAAWSQGTWDLPLGYNCSLFLLCSYLYVL